MTSIHFNVNITIDYTLIDIISFVAILFYFILIVFPTTYVHTRFIFGARITTYKHLLFI